MKRNVTIIAISSALCLLIASASLAETKKSSGATASSQTPTKTAVTPTPAVPVTQQKAEVTSVALLRSVGTSMEEVKQQIAPQPGVNNRVASGEQLKWQVISSGGGSSSSASYQLVSAIGQTASGPALSVSYKAQLGFLQNFGTAGCCMVAGDANSSTTVNIADVTFLIARIFSGGAAPACCQEGDANGGGTINIGDVTYLIARIFSSGPAPVCGPPGMTCMAI